MAKYTFSTTAKRSLISNLVVFSTHTETINLCEFSAYKNIQLLTAANFINFNRTEDDSSTMLSCTTNLDASKKPS